MSEAINYPGEQWIPSNGTVGYSFVEHECGTCERDKNEDCPILAASFRGEAVEWRDLGKGEIKCMKFVPAGSAIPPEPDNHTADMFGATPQGQEVAPVPSTDAGEK